MASLRQLNCLVLLTLVLVSVCMSAQVPGGLSEEKQVDEDVRRVLRRIHEHIERMQDAEYETLQPLSYKRQLVSGYNYYIKVLATRTDGQQEHLHVRAYRPFKGHIELTAIRKVKDQHEPLEYFQ